MNSECKSIYVVIQNTSWIISQTYLVLLNNSKFVTQDATYLGASNRAGPRFRGRIRELHTFEGEPIADCVCSYFILNELKY